MSTLFRKILTGTVAAAGIGAMIAATSTPAAAWGYGHRGWGGPGPVIAGAIGGFALGALAAGAGRPYYAAPAYAEPVYTPPVSYDYGPVCHQEWRPVYRSDGLYLRDRLVRVCD